MTNKPPKKLTDAGYEIYCNTVKLQEINIPIVDFDIDKLLWNLDMPFWQKDGTNDWNLTPQEVINKIDGSATHQQRVAKADLQYAILLLKKNEAWLIVDGVHRLVKAIQAKQKTIRAKILTQDIVEKYST